MQAQIEAHSLVHSLVCKCMVWARNSAYNETGLNKNSLIRQSDCFFCLAPQQSARTLITMQGLFLKHWQWQLGGAPYLL
jgi:hypothetical protein